MYTWIMLAALGASVVAMGFFVVTIFSLQDMLDVQRKTEDRLRESEEWLRAVVDNTKTLISVKQIDGRYVTVNRRFESVMGVAGLIALGRRDEDLFAPETAAALRTHDDRVVAENDSVELDQTLRVGSGKARRFYVVKTPLHDVVGNVTGVCTVATDITERELARRERDRIFELSSDMMSAGTFDGYLKLVNPQWERVTGYTADELRSQPGFDLVHPDDRDDAAAAMDALRAGRELVDFQTRIRCKDGTYKLCQWRVMPTVEEGMVYAVGREIEEGTARSFHSAAMGDELVEKPRVVAGSRR